MGRKAALFALVALVLVACSGSGDGGAQGTAPTAVAVPQASPVDANVVVYASPTCGCCHEYIPYLEANGVSVKTEVIEDVNSIKAEYEIPEEAWSCHTSIVGDYYVEGHVPVEAIAKLLDERPSIDGIALPGMPLGSPGMNGEKAAPFEIVAIKNGEIQPFMTI